MRGRSRDISKSVLACIAVLGGAAVGGLVAGFNAREGFSPQPASATFVAAIADVAPSDWLIWRFPGDGADAAFEPVSRMLALASADGDISLSPRPTYAAPDTDAPARLEAMP